MQSPAKHAIRTNAIATLAIYSTLMLISIRAGAQMSMPSTQSTQSQPQIDAATQTQDTQAQITQLRQQVAQLQAALQQSKAKKTSSSKGAMGAAKPAMGMEDDSGEMGSMFPDTAKPPMGPMKDRMGGMGEMTRSRGAMKGESAAPMAGPGCCGMSMGMPMASKAGGMPMEKMPMKSGSMASKVPTPPSAEPPHLLHIGAKDFFLDHLQHLRLTSKQEAQLEKLKADALQRKATSQAQIDQGEQELWQLTSADQPNPADIDKKVQEIAKMRADQQVAFIHAVAAASDVLTPDQRAEIVKTTLSTTGAKITNAKTADE